MPEIFFVPQAMSGEIGFISAGVDKKKEAENKAIEREVNALSLKWIPADLRITTEEMAVAGRSEVGHVEKKATVVQNLTNYLAGLKATLRAAEGKLLVLDAEGLNYKTIEIAPAAPNFRKQIIDVSANEIKFMTPASLAPRIQKSAFVTCERQANELGFSFLSGTGFFDDSERAKRNEISQQTLVSQKPRSPIQ